MDLQEKGVGEYLMNIVADLLEKLNICFRDRISEAEQVWIFRHEISPFTVTNGGNSLSELYFNTSQGKVQHKKGAIHMPRTRLDKNNERHKVLKTLLWGNIKRDNASLQDGASKLGMSISTLCRRCKDPGTMTVDELLNFGRKYNIEIGELREAIRY